MPVTTATSPITFVLDKFSASYTLDQRATLDAGVTYSFTDASAVAVYYISKTAIKNVFTFNSDSWDFNDVSSQDIHYFINMNNWPAGLEINPVNAMLDKVDLAKAMLQVGIPNKMFVKHDFIRYLAYKLFNTANGVDLFNNERDLIQHLNAMGNASFQRDISGTLNTYASESSTAVIADQFIIDTSSNTKCTTNMFTDNDNICRELFNQILNNNPARFHDISFNIKDAEGDLTGQASLPFITGDTISYRFTVFPNVGQETLTGVDRFGGRSYEIKLVVDDAGVNTAGDSGDTFIPPNLSY